MDALYRFATGPLAWLTLGFFVAGSAWRLVRMVQMARKEKVILPYMDLRHSLRSLAHWLFPFGARNMRLRPVMTVVTFAFHISVVVTPLFLLAHVELWRQAWGFGWVTVSERAADGMTLVVLAGVLFFFLRRLVQAEVLRVTTWGDWGFLALVLGTFGTGFLAHHQLFDYRTLMVLHVLFGEAMLVAIPLTRLSHMLYFFFTRAYMGCEFGLVRHARDW
jgi:nitrate reductase gamma subunit